MSNIVYDKLEEIEKLLQEAMEFKKVFQDSNNAIANQYNFVLQSIQDTKEEYNKFGEDLNSKLKEVEKPLKQIKYKNKTVKENTKLTNDNQILSSKAQILESELEKSKDEVSKLKNNLNQYQEEINKYKTLGNLSKLEDIYLKYNQLLDFAFTNIDPFTQVDVIEAKHYWENALKK